MFPLRHSVKHLALLTGVCGFLQFRHPFEQAHSAWKRNIPGASEIIPHTESEKLAELRKDAKRNGLSARHIADAIDLVSNEHPLDHVAQMMLLETLVEYDHWVVPVQKTEESKDSDEASFFLLPDSKFRISASQKPLIEHPMLKDSGVILREFPGVAIFTSPNLPVNIKSLVLLSEKNGVSFPEPSEIIPVLYKIAFGVNAKRAVLKLDELLEDKNKNNIEIKRLAKQIFGKQREDVYFWVVSQNEDPMDGSGERDNMDLLVFSTEGKASYFHSKLPPQMAKEHNLFGIKPFHVHQYCRLHSTGVAWDASPRGGKVLALSSSCLWNQEEVEYLYKLAQQE